MLDSGDGDGIAWFADWKTFLTDVLGTSYPEDLDPSDDGGEREEYIVDTLEIFSKKFQFATQSIPAGEQEESTHE
ncbi:hypothetical protein SAMN05216321_101156 [Cupriavidus sp. OV038]|nr:hypothetical protein SAMN05216321_101156 [Cupriavidus sp. OV038]SFO58540.1 hypothetical protein SAMN05216322_101156 [Cupriavidus sp. OV096]